MDHLGIDHSIIHYEYAVRFQVSQNFLRMNSSGTVSLVNFQHSWESACSTDAILSRYYTSSVYVFPDWDSCLLESQKVVTRKRCCGAYL